MIRFLQSQLRFRRGRAMTLGVGILVAAVSFTLLTAAATTSELQLRGTVDENFRAAYDILVRPTGSFTGLESERGLVRANYLSGIFGGITAEQYATVAALDGIDIAAPIANIGYILPPATIPIVMNSLLDEGAVQLYRFRLEWVTNRGLSRYPGGEGYVYYTSANPFVALDGGRPAPPGLGEPHEIVPGEPQPLPVCTPFVYDHFGEPRQAQQSPYDRSGPSLNCFSSQSPEVVHGLPPGAVGALTQLRPPILLAAIDPEEERRLLAIDDAVVDGRYLRDDEPPFLAALDGRSLQAQMAPVLVSTRTFVDEELEVSVERLDVPSGTDVPRTLADENEALSFLPGLSGRVVDRQVIRPGPVYGDLLDKLAGPPTFFNVVVAYWTGANPTYRRHPGGPLAPVPVRNPDDVWQMPLTPGSFGSAPPGNEDVQFRRLTVHGGSVGAAASPTGGEILDSAGIQVVGRFDPHLLPGFSPLSEVPLETYYPPVARPADEAADQALEGRTLLPTMNLGDYLAQPPLMLTTLEAAGVFNDPDVYGDAERSAPISVIRVRVAGVTGPDPVSRERIRRVAEEIVERTGLPVDVTAGSSPTPITIELPAGEYGRPSLTLEEGWVRKGVSVAVLTGIDRKSAALFALVLLVCGLFLANGALASVRSRRVEIGVLRGLGWSRGAVFRAVLGELVLVGVVAGTVGMALAAGLVEAFRLKMPFQRTLLVGPVAVALTLFAGLWPAVLAARARPVDALRPAVSPPRSARPVRSLAGMAVRNLRRLPARTLLGTTGLAVGVACLVVMLGINLAFDGLLVGTLLGGALAVQVRPVDYASVALAIGLGGLSVADVLYLNLRERTGELVTLRTSGWRNAHLTRLGALEALGLGTLGSLAGVAVGLTVAVLIGGGLTPRLGLLAAAAAAGGIVVALAASLVPLRALSRLIAPTALAED